MARKPPADPHYEREAAKYDNPIPSREFILDFLRQKGEPLPFPALMNGLGLYEPDHEIALDRRLRAMQRGGQLVLNRRGLWCLPDKLDLKAGKVEGHRDGFGFVLMDEGGPDWVLSAREMKKVLHGDRVLVAQTGRDRKGRIEAQIVEILDDAPRYLVGRFVRESGFNALIPTDTRFARDFFIAQGEELNAKPNQMVVAQLMDRGGFHLAARVKVTEVLGEHLAPGMEIQIAIRNYGLPHQFSPATENDMTQWLPQVAEADKKGRIDLRELPLVTIDGEDAKDFDDAVYCERKKSGGWRLWVAIADVSHYVKINSALDRDAQERGNSVYFPEYVIPMLPELLSNGLCSLKPEVDRLCLVAEMTVSDAGNLSSYRFYPAVMNSKMRFTYTRVWALLNNDAPKNERELQLVPHLQALHGLYNALRQAREMRGALELETRETRIVFNDDRKIEKIVPLIRNDAHKLIEECMILANVATAKFLNKNKQGALYRVHTGPNQKKIDVLREQLSALKLFLGGGNEPSPLDYADLMTRIRERPDADSIQMMVLRSLTQAVYEPELAPHFGLALPAYAHFTSPIRRYPDLVVHRAVKSVLKKSDEKMVGNDGAVDYNEAELSRLGSQCSSTERRADEATRDVVMWLKCEFMRDKLGSVHNGKVVSVAGFGLFVELDDIFVEGLVHVSSLRNDYYHYDAARQALIGERTQQRFTLGDRVKVQVADVDLDERKIDFLYLGRHDLAIEKSPASAVDDSEWTDARLREKRLNAIRKALERDGVTSEKMAQDSHRARRDESPAKSSRKSSRDKSKVRNQKPTAGAKQAASKKPSKKKRR